MENWTIPEVAPDLEFRRSLELQAKIEGGATIYEELRRISPDTAAQIPPTNIRRIVRALEVYRAVGSRPSTKPRKGQPPFEPFFIGLTMERIRLYEAINTRVDNMIQLGFVDEVRRLIAEGYGPELPAMSSVGYGEVTGYLEGRTSLTTAVERIKTRTHRFARHQYAWFRLGDKRINWHDTAESPALAFDQVRIFLNRTKAST